MTRGLMAQASKKARALGHSLEPWNIGVTRRHRVTTCINCGLYAVVTSAPDEEPMVGSTLAVPCRGRRTRAAWALVGAFALAAIQELPL